MSGVTEFKTVSGRTPNDFDTGLNAALAAGYQPIPGSGPYVIQQGGVTCMTLVKGAIILVGSPGADGTNGTNGVDGAVKTFYGETSSAANTYAVTITGAALSAGNVFAIKFDHAPTGAATLNVNALGAKPIVVATGAAIAGAQGSDGQIATMIYDGTSFIYVVSPNNAV
jgi:hypothetical protein